MSHPLRKVRKSYRIIELVHEFPGYKNQYIGVPIHIANQVSKLFSKAKQLPSTNRGINQNFNTLTQFKIFFDYEILH